MEVPVFLKVEELFNNNYLTINENEKEEYFKGIRDKLCKSSAKNLTNFNLTLNAYKASKHIIDTETKTLFLRFFRAGIYVGNDSDTNRINSLKNADLNVEQIEKLEPLEESKTPSPQRKRSFNKSHSHDGKLLNSVSLTSMPNVNNEGNLSNSVNFFSMPNLNDVDG